MGGSLSSPSKHEPYSLVVRDKSPGATFTVRFRRNGTRRGESRSAHAPLLPSEQYDPQGTPPSDPQGAGSAGIAAEEKVVSAAGGSQLATPTSLRGRRTNEEVGTAEARDKAKSEWSKLRNTNVAAAAMLGGERGRRGNRRERRRTGSGTPQQDSRTVGSFQAEGAPRRRLSRRDSAREAESPVPGPQSRSSPLLVPPSAGGASMPEVPIRSSSALTFNHFEQVEIIGVGGLAQVQLMRPRKEPSRLLAVKIMHKREISRRRMVRYVRREVEVLTALARAGAGASAAEALARGETPAAPAVRTPKKFLPSGDEASAADAGAGAAHTPCPFLVTLLARVKDGARVGLVLDFAAGGDLYTRMHRVRCFPEAVAKFYFAEVLEALDFLHSQRIAFRDLKPENSALPRPRGWVPPQANAHGALRRSLG